MGRPRIMTATEVGEAHEKYVAGETIDELAEEYYMSRTTILTEFKRTGLWVNPKRGKPRPLKLKPEQVKEAAEMVQRGKTHEQISEMLGISASCVRASLKRNGYATRRVKG